MPALLSAFLSLHKVSESPVFVRRSACWYRAHYSLCNPLVNLGHNVHRCALTKAPLCRVDLPLLWKWKAGDSVTSNENRTSHPTGCSRHLESRPLQLERHRMTWTKKICFQWINEHMCLLSQQQTDRLPAAVLFSQDNWTLHDLGFLPKNTSDLLGKVGGCDFLRNKINKAGMMNSEVKDY